MVSDSSSTQPYRTVTIALLGFLILFLIGLGVTYGLLTVMSSAGQCEELALLLCGIIALPIAISIAVLVELLAVKGMMKKKHIPHPVAIPLFATTTMLIGSYIFVGMYIGPALAGVIAGILFIASFVFYDWLFNVVKGSFSSKVLGAIAGLGILIIIKLLLTLFISG